MICADLFFFAAAAVFLIGFKRSMRADPFTHTTLNKMGLLIYFSVLGLMGLFMIIYYAVDPASMNLDKFINMFTYTMLYFALITSPLMIGLCLALCVSNLQLIRKEGFHPVNLLGILISVVMMVLLPAGIFIYEHFISLDNLAVMNILLNCYYGLYVYAACLLMGVFVLFTRISLLRSSLFSGLSGYGLELKRMSFSTLSGYLRHIVSPTYPPIE